MKLIHVRVYPRVKKEVEPWSGEEEAIFIVQRETNDYNRIISTLEKANLKVNEDYVIIVSYGIYTGKGNFKEMEFEVFDI